MMNTKVSDFSGVSAQSQRRLIKVEIRFEEEIDMTDGDEVELSADKISDIVKQKLQERDYVVEKNKKSSILRSASTNFEKIPEIFKSLMEIRTPNKSQEENYQGKTASGRKLPISGEEADSDMSAHDFDLTQNGSSPLLELLICDKFKESYESSLNKKTPSPTCEHVSKNKSYQLSVLFGNISYSIGMFDKAIQFYERALFILHSEISQQESHYTSNANSDSDSEGNLSETESVHLIHFALLENNIARCLINSFKISEGIKRLKRGYRLLNKGEGGGDLHSSEDKDQVLFLLINILFNLAEAYYIIEDCHRSQKYLTKSHSLFSRKTHFTTLMQSKYLELMGKIDMSNNNHTKAIENFDNCLKLLKSEAESAKLVHNSNGNTSSTGPSTTDKHEIQIRMSEIYNNLAIAHSQLKENEIAINYIERSLSIRRKIFGEDSIKTLMTYTNLGHLYQTCKKNKSALETLQEALSKGEDNKEVEGIFNAVIYRALGQCYFALGNEIKGLNNYSKANIIYKKYYQEKITSLSEMNMIIKNMYGLITI